MGRPAGRYARRPIVSIWYGGPHCAGFASDDWFRAEPELHDWIAANTKPWDGVDTFNWQSNIPW